MQFYAKQPIATQTAFAQLQQTAVQTFGAHAQRAVRGNFSVRRVKKRPYWYFRFTDAIEKRVQQVYLGPETSELCALADAYRIARERADTIDKTTRRHARIAAAAGVALTPTYYLKRIRQLAEYGFFHDGAILLGEHALTAFSNLLGVRWLNQAGTEPQGQHPSCIAAQATIGLPAARANTPASAIERLRLGFQPLESHTGQPDGWRQLDHRSYGIDFMTPETGQNMQSISASWYGLEPKPQTFMEVLFEEASPCVLLDQTSAVVVNLPCPARYAIHELLLYGECQTRWPPEAALKRNTHLHRAAALIAALSQGRQLELIDAWKGVLSRGRVWSEALDVGALALRQQYPKSAWIRLYCPRPPFLGGAGSDHFPSGCSMSNVLTSG